MKNETLALIKNCVLNVIRLFSFIRKVEIENAKKKILSRPLINQKQPAYQTKRIIEKGEEK